MVHTARGDDWTDAEVVATVGDYLEMLRAELAGLPYSKSEHRRALLASLSPGRTEAAIEFKHQNISAVMLELGLPNIRGYRPARNYQRALAAELKRRLSIDKALFEELQRGCDPRPTGRLERGAPPAGMRRPLSTRVVDYEALQAENRRLGALGERLVVEFERAVLETIGRLDLAERVRWVAEEDGVGAGYDVLSFTPAGAPRFIEVKTTALGPETPFYLSSAEIAFAVEHAGSYAIHRVYHVDNAPRFFPIVGDPTLVLELSPVVFRARLK
jgi:Domain of unknown function (DUF3883)